RIVASRNPCVSTGSKGQRQISPGVAAGLTGTSDRRRAPNLAAGRGIVSRDEADVLFIARTSGYPGNHFSAHDDGAGSISIPQRRVGNLGVPNEVARSRVNRNDVGIVGGRENPVAKDREISLRASGWIAGQIGRRARGPILP